jgi:thymidylate kinase
MKKQNSLIIEFVGPPGAGKSTNCRSFDQLLKNKGFAIYKLQDIKDYIKQMGLTGKFLLLLKFSVFRTVHLLLFTIMLASYRIYSVNALYRYIRITLFDLALKQFQQSRKVDIFLLEQWIIQELWSATIFKLKSYDEIGTRLCRFYFRSDVTIYFDIDVATASERISQRNTSLSRFDKMDTTKRIKELSKHNNYLFQLYNQSDCLQKHLFSGYNRPESNAATFADKLTVI